ncbi:hypothetical protein [Xanthobacter sp. KR7-225]|uniref:hypothetical protein n=1 Tax=Xanthobacter sp. KR7-225 TaxID=3156613 RepID=UPI0032B5243C
MSWRGHEPGPSDPGILHAVLLQPDLVWPAGDRIPLTLGVPGDALRPRWRYLMFQTGGTVLLEDEAGTVLPYTRDAGAVLPLCATAIVKAAAHGISGQPTETTSTLVLYGAM